MAALADAITEVLELCEALLVNIEQQLLYYRASVYKDEAVDTANGEITKLQNVLEMFNNSELLEPLADYRALQLNDLKLAPGECSFSKKITMLVTATRMQLHKYRDGAHANAGVIRQIQQKSNKLMSLCHQGSHQWNFFRSL